MPTSCWPVCAAMRRSRRRRRDAGSGATAHGRTRAPARRRAGQGAQRVRRAERRRQRPERAGPYRLRQRRHRQRPRGEIAKTEIRYKPGDEAKAQLVAAHVPRRDARCRRHSPRHRRRARARHDFKGIDPTAAVRRPRPPHPRSILRRPASSCSPRRGTGSRGSAPVGRSLSCCAVSSPLLLSARAFAGRLLDLSRAGLHADGRGVAAVNRGIDDQLANIKQIDLVLAPGAARGRELRDPRLRLAGVREGPGRRDRLR